MFGVLECRGKSFWAVGFLGLRVLRFRVLGLRVLGCGV